MRLSIQATEASLEWEGESVRLIVETILPDTYVLAVVEELQRQKARLPALPDIFIRMETDGLEKTKAGDETADESPDERPG